jgi:hypothetical protein
VPKTGVATVHIVSVAVGVASVTPPEPAETPRLYTC